jgi:predicted negative regulator of RcsB-dependent stress response
MSAHLEDEAQVEAIKKWWTANGRGVLIGIALAVLLGSAWQYWQHERALTARSASQHYDQMVALTDSNAILAHAQLMAKDNDSHMYRDLARLKLAQQWVEGKAYDKASVVLREVIDTASAPMFKQLASIRLARILLFQKAYDQALAVLTVEHDEGLRSWVYWLQGDCYMAKGDSAKAAQMYAWAKSLFTEGTFASSLLNMQLLRMGDMASLNTGDHHEK